MVDITLTVKIKEDSAGVSVTVEPDLVLGYRCDTWYQVQSIVDKAVKDAIQEALR